MTLTLTILAMIAAANPLRALAARPTPLSRAALAAAVGTTLALVSISAAAAGPLLDLIDIAGPSARIAAGIALLAVALKDVFLAPPAPEPALPGWKAGVVPLAFPVLFSPALALLAVAAGAERGIAVTLLAAVVALVPAAAALDMAPSWPHRVGPATIGGFGAGVAALVVLDGVYAI